jgi:hypothetical protein
MLEQDSGIHPDVINSRGYRTVTSHAELQRLGFGRGQCPAPALLIPVYDLDGRVALYQARSDRPRMNREGQLARYEVPRGAKLTVDVPPSVRPKVLDPSEPLFVVMGVRSADSVASRDAACVGILSHLGVRNHAATWDRIPLAARTVTVAWKATGAGDSEARNAAVALGEFLRASGANVTVVTVPAAPDGRAQGVDEWLARGHTPAELTGLEALTAEPSPVVPTEVANHSYRRTVHGLVMDVPGKGGDVTVRPLTNFDVRISADVVVTDGAEQWRELEIDARVADNRVTATVPAEEFSQMAWVVPHLGPMAVLAAGSEIRDHVRAAIQATSGAIPSVHAYTHLGWVRTGAANLFLFSGGAIGAGVAAHWAGEADGRTAPTISRFPAIGDGGPDGTPHIPDDVINGMRVRAREPLKRFRFPVPPPGDELKAAIRDSLELLAVASDPISYPLYAAVWRAPLGDANYSLGLDGGTGNGKSTLVALFQQHFGAEMDADHLPTGWGSTANYLEAMCFEAKDVLVTLDDWVARGSQADVDRANRDADRFFRGQGNRSGRGRCSANGTPRPARHSRCLPVCTQEESPVGHSLNARVLRLDVGKNDVLAPANLARLSRLQELARDGRFAAAMAGYVAHLAADLDGTREMFHEHREELRAVFQADRRHPRTATIAADLTAAFNVFLNFALEVGAIGEEERAGHWERIHLALHEKLDDQHRHLAAQDPVTQLLHCLHAGIASGRCHVANRVGEAPDSRPDAWGWRQESVYVARSPFPDTRQESSEKPAPPAEEDEVEERSRWRPRGTRLGWVINERVYLLGEVALGEAQRIARDMGHRLAIQYSSLGRVLSDAGLLVDRDRSRGRYTKRINAEGGRRNTFCLDSQSLMRREFYLADFAEGDYDGPDPGMELLG